MTEPQISVRLREAQTHFVELMVELFQLDEAEALDFGIYRVIRHRNRAVREFLGEVETHGDHKALTGGKLQAILEAEFAATDAEAGAQMDAQLRALETDLGLQRHMGENARESKLGELSGIPALAPKVREYRQVLEQRAAAGHGSDDRLEVLNRLYQFFDRHYQDGDFIVQRRYGRDAQRYIRSTGEDTEFRWATEDMYYVKSGDIFTDWPVKLAHGTHVVFAVDKDSLEATRKELKPTDKAHYELKTVKQDGDTWRVLLDYKKGAATKTQQTAIVAKVREKTGEAEDDIHRWLKRYAARNQSDFFIHKRLGEALNEELDIFLKTDVLDVSQLLAGEDRALRHARVARSVQRVGKQIIAFLAALEDFQKQLWEKKKLVLETRYIITLDRIEKLAGRDWLEARLSEIVKHQKQEWQDLGLGEYKKPKDCERKTQDGQFSHYLPLPVDTGKMGATFKWELFGKLAAGGQALDMALDGVAVESENWQALNVFQSKACSNVKCVYVDPPYNAESSLIAYKNTYRHSTWLTMMEDRLLKASRLLEGRDGVFEVAIDENEQETLGRLLQERIFPNRYNYCVCVVHNPRGQQSANISPVHEYLYVSIPEKGRKSLSDRVLGDPDVRNLRDSGNESMRTDARTCFYPIYVNSDEVIGFGDVPDAEFHPSNQSVELEDGRIAVWPIDTDGGERKWRYSRDSVESIQSDLQVKYTSSGVQIYFAKTHSTHRSLFDDSRYDASEYGTKVLQSMLGRDLAKRFTYPKSLYLVKDAVAAGVAANGDAQIVVDFFAGSGTTAHAVLDLSSDTLPLKFIVVEINKYFEDVMMARIKKCGAARTVQWSNGIAKTLDGRGLFIRVQRLEQYDDTLENLALDPEQNGGDELPFEDAATLLRWRLDGESKHVFCAVDRFRSPFGYRLKRAQGAGAAEPVEVDLVESLVWLLGLDVATMRREPQGVAITGKNRRGESVLVAFRDCDAKGSGDWVMRLLAEHTADRVYTNDPADLAFAGAEKLESIEAVFALQFGSVA